MEYRNAAIFGGLLAVGPPPLSWPKNGIDPLPLCSTEDEAEEDVDGRAGGGLSTTWTCFNASTVV